MKKFLNWLDKLGRKRIVMDRINNEPYLEIYNLTYNPDGTFGTPVLVNELNSKYNDGPLAVSADGNTVYFTRNNFIKGKKGQNSEGTVFLKI